MCLPILAHTIGASVAGAAAAALFGQNGLLWFSLCFILAILLFTEILPKTIGVNFAQQIGLHMVLPLRLMIFVLKPLVIVAQLMTRLVPGGQVQHRFSAEELKTIASLSRKSGVIQGFLRVVSPVLFDELRRRLLGIDADSALLCAASRLIRISGDRKSTR